MTRRLIAQLAIEAERVILQHYDDGTSALIVVQKGDLGEIAAETQGAPKWRGPAEIGFKTS